MIFTINSINYPKYTKEIHTHISMNIKFILFFRIKDLESYNIYLIPEFQQKLDCQYNSLYNIY